MKTLVAVLLLTSFACAQKPTQEPVGKALPETGAVSFREATVNLNGLRLHYLEWPHEGAPAMLLIPGTGGGGGSARGFTPFAAAMRDRYHVWALEPRGHGESEWAKEYGWQLVLQDIDAFVDHFRLSPVIVIGASSGGFYGYLYAANHPSKVRGLIAVDFGLGFPSPKPGAQRPNDVTFASPEETIEFAKSRWGTDPSVDAVVRDWIEHGVRQLANGRWAFRVDPALLDSIRRELAQPNGDEFLVAQLRKIRSPVLVVRGAQSGFTTEAATRTASAIPGGRFAEVPKSGHVVLLANPAGFLAAVNEFLTNTDQPALENDKLKPSEVPKK